MVGRIRHSILTMLDGALRLKTKPLTLADWQESALVIAPHPDDETLGCGGVAHKKLKAGVDVGFLFVTDGANSHRNRIGPGPLKAQRRLEAIEAVRRLGGAKQKITFLEIPDGDALANVDAIAGGISDHLRRSNWQSVFLPHASEPPADHIAVSQGAIQALQGCRRRMTVFEYPVWYWHHWPSVSLGLHEQGGRRAVLSQTLKCWAGLGALSAFNVKAFIGDVISVKRDALSAHESQVTCPLGQDDWPILADVSGGDFLARLMSDHEFFRRYEIGN